MELFDRHIRPLPNVTVEILEGATHGFKGGGWNPESMVERLVSGTKRFVDNISSGKKPADKA
jgi:hypothetical protein